MQLWKKKWNHFDLKNWVTGGTKIRPEIPSNWRIFDLNWLSISSLFDSNILQILRIPDRTSVPPVTQFFRSKWLHFFFQWMQYHDTSVHWLAYATKYAHPFTICFIVIGYEGMQRKNQRIQIKISFRSDVLKLKPIVPLDKADVMRVFQSKFFEKCLGYSSANTIYHSFI